MKRTGPTNYQVLQLVQQLGPRARENRFWKRVVHDLQKPTRQRREVNVYKIDRYTQAGETVLVPGKVLSVGNLTKPVQVAAMSFSQGAREKIQQARGKILSIEELLRQNPEGKKVRILG